MKNRTPGPGSTAISGDSCTSATTNVSTNTSSIDQRPMNSTIRYSRVRSRALRAEPPLARSTSTYASATQLAERDHHARDQHDERERPRAGRVQVARRRDMIVSGCEEPSVCVHEDRQQVRRHVAGWPRQAAAPTCAGSRAGAATRGRSPQRGQCPACAGAAGRSARPHVAHAITPALAALAVTARAPAPERPPASRRPTRRAATPRARRTCS